MSAKGGLMMGTKKGGGSPQPAKKSQYHYNKKNAVVKKKIKKNWISIILWIYPNKVFPIFSFKFQTIHSLGKTICRVWDRGSAAFFVGLRTLSKWVWRIWGCLPCIGGALQGRIFSKYILTLSLFFYKNFDKTSKIGSKFFLEADSMLDKALNFTWR